MSPPKDSPARRLTDKLIGMSAQSLEVISHEEGVLVLAGPGPLTTPISGGFARYGLEVLVLDPATSKPGDSRLTQFAENKDIDYVVACATPALAPWYPYLQSLISGGVRVVVAAPIRLGDAVRKVLSGARICLYGDVVGGGMAEASMLETMVEMARSEGEIVIPGEGVEEYSIASAQSVGERVVQATVTPGWEGEITVAAPAATSLLALAHMVSTAFSKKIRVRFDTAGSWKDVDYDWETIASNVENLGGETAAASEKEIVAYIHAAGSSSSHLESETMTRPPIAPRVPAPTGDFTESASGTKNTLSNAPSRPPAMPIPDKKAEVSNKAEKREATPPARHSPKFPDPTVRRLGVAAMFTSREKTRLSNLEFVPIVPEHEKLRTRLSHLMLPEKEKKGGEKKKKKNPLKTVFGRGVIIAIALYVGTLAASATVTALTARSLISALAAGSLPAGNFSLAEFCGTYLEANAITLAAFPGVGSTPAVQDAVTIMAAYNQGLTIASAAVTLEGDIGKISKYVLTDATGDIAGDISTARLDIEGLYTQIALLDGALPDATPTLLANYASRYTTIKAKIGELKTTALTAKALLGVLPDTIGVGGRKKYLVLFQNNMELRPTGGFIGSFALMSFDNGHLYDMPVFDVYAADGQLKGHVEPPQPVKEVLGEANWYLRDSNFDPDFPTSARRAEWFIQKEMNETTDGTIGVTMGALQNLLRATGPLEISDYQETVTADNIFSRAELHAEVNFFPGSQQKKEYLSAVADALFTKLHTASAGNMLKLLSAVSTSLTGKEIQISVANPATEHAFSALNWDGSITDAPCPTTNASCIKDYLMIVDSNFGVNKANYYVDRKVGDAVTIGKDGSVTHDLKLQYVNRSTSSAWPAGDYKDYQRLYLPPDATVSAVMVGNTALAQADYTVAPEHGKTVVGYLVGVPINSAVAVEVRYTIPGKVGSGSIYTWYWQKQGGTSTADPVQFSVSYPLFLHPSVISPAAQSASQQLNFALENSGDRRATIQFN